MKALKQPKLKKCPFCRSRSSSIRLTFQPDADGYSGILKATAACNECPAEITKLYWTARADSFSANEAKLAELLAAEAWNTRPTRKRKSNKGNKHE